MKRATIGRPCLRDCDALYLPEAGIRELAIKLREKKTREEERERGRERERRNKRKRERSTKQGNGAERKSKDGRC